MGTKKAENKGLSPKRQRFVEEYLKDCNATQAAIRAGYSDKNADVQGSSLLGIIGVKAAIEEGLSKLRSSAIADAAERREFWSRMMRSDDEESKDRLKASELLGKAQGDFVERKEIIGKLEHSVSVDLSRLSKEELASALALSEKIHAAAS